MLDKSVYTTHKQQMFHRLKLTKSHIHPLVYITFALIAGIWWQEASGKLIHCSATLLCGVVAALATQTGLRNQAIFFCLLTCGFTAGASLLYLQHKNHTALQERLCSVTSSLRGTVTGKEPSGNPALNSCLFISLDSVQHNNHTWQSAAGTVQIYARYEKNILVGDTIELRNITLRSTAGTSFDNYLIKNDIIATAFINHLDYSLVSRPYWSITRTIWTARDELSRRLRSKLSYQTSSLFLLTFLGTNLGNKKQAQKTKDLFKIWGILHFLARSGLHLVIFIVMWEFLLKFIPLPFMIKQIILIIISSLYCILSWPSLPFIRALSTFLLYKVGPWTNSRGSSLYLLALVACVILLLNPVQLLFLDFQLSFGLTFVLAWFSQLQQQKRVFAQKC